MKITQAAVAALISLAIVPLPCPADPPPHAKAHGWRKKNDPNYIGYTGKKWEKDYGVIEGRCNTSQVGAVVGGVVGGAVGGAIGSQADKEVRPVAIMVGTVIGAVIGAKIGQSVDDADRGCMGHALELAGEKKTVVWTNDRTGVTYRLTPTRNYQDVSKPCRDFVTELSAKNGKKDRVVGTACRQGNGDWQFRS